MLLSAFRFALSLIFCLISTLALAQVQTGWWWNPNEGGRGYSIELSQSSGQLFFGAFMYDNAGAPVWYVGTLSQTTGTTYSGNLLQYQGGKTLAGPYRPPASPTIVGTAQLGFSTDSSAALSISGPGLNPTNITIQRYPIVPGGVGAGSTSIQPHTGWWWNPNEAGCGYFLEIQNSTMLFVLFLYDANGKPVWYLTQNALTTDSSYSGTLVQYGNGQTLGGPYRPAGITNGNVGRLVLQSSIAAPATGTLTLPNGAQVPIQRYSF